MNIRFDGKRALVTGAGKGMGKGIAEALVAGGAETYALSRTQEDLAKLKDENPGLHTVCVDLADWATARRAVEQIGPVDLLVNNAGILIPTPFLETEETQMDKASASAVVNHTAYCASKGALDQVTRVMALEFGPHQIRVNCVNPTVVMTAMGKRLWSDPVKSAAVLSKIPQEKLPEVKDIVHPVLYLLSDKADMINGVTLVVDGGRSVA
ncbi:L-xylulose reductase [Lamellibrachia satsuma]|nr:L-xylulose reductase [Lamellibrachia satsuma]